MGMAVAKKRAPGRPRTRNYDDKKAWASVGGLIPRRLKEKLDEIAAESGRSTSEEISRRLQHTLDADALVHDAPEMRVVAHLVAALQENADGATWRNDDAMWRDVVGYVFAFFWRNGPEDIRTIPFHTLIEIVEADFGFYRKNLERMVELTTPTIRRAAAPQKGEAQ
jgi:CRP-like cAMP-binding protein